MLTWLTRFFLAWRLDNFSVVFIYNSSLILLKAISCALFSVIFSFSVYSCCLFCSFTVSLIVRIAILVSTINLYIFSAICCMLLNHCVIFIDLQFYVQFAQFCRFHFYPRYFFILKKTWGLYLIETPLFELSHPRLFISSYICLGFIFCSRYLLLVRLRDTVCYLLCEGRVCLVADKAHGKNLLNSTVPYIGTDVVPPLN